MILSRIRPEVKPTRRTARPSAPFGVGILAPARRPAPPAPPAPPPPPPPGGPGPPPGQTGDAGVTGAPPPPISGGSPAADGPDWDALADEALGQARLDMGLCC